MHALGLSVASGKVYSNFNCAACRMVGSRARVSMFPCQVVSMLRKVEL